MLQFAMLVAEDNCRQHFGPLAVILHCHHTVEGLGRVADDAAVRSDERHARAKQLAKPIRFLVGFGDRAEGGTARHQRGRETRLGDKRPFDPLVQLPPRRRGEKQTGDNQRHDSGGKGGKEELELKTVGELGTDHRALPAGGGSSSL